MDLRSQSGKRKRARGGNSGEEIALNVGGGSEELLRPISQPKIDKGTKQQRLKVNTLAIVRDVFAISGITAEECSVTLNRLAGKRKRGNQFALNRSDPVENRFLEALDSVLAQLREKGANLTDYKLREINNALLRKAHFMARTDQSREIGFWQTITGRAFYFCERESWDYYERV